MVSDDEDDPSQASCFPSLGMLIQAAGIILIAVAAASLPQMIYVHLQDHQPSPDDALMQAQLNLDVIKWIAKVFVGGLMLVLVKKRMLPASYYQLPKPAEPAGKDDHA